VTPASPPGFGSERQVQDDSLFVQAQAGMLPDPVISPRPAPPKNRRKTIALGFTATRSSLRLKASGRGAPIAKLAQRNLLRKLGIVDDGDDVSQEAINDFVQLFRQQLPPSAIAALRAMFKMARGFDLRLESPFVTLTFVHKLYTPTFIFKFRMYTCIHSLYPWFISFPFYLLPPSKKRRLKFI
jgi:hypothetical protein